MCSCVCVCVCVHTCMCTLPSYAMSTDRDGQQLETQILSPGCSALHVSGMIKYRIQTEEKSSHTPENLLEANGRK